MLAIFDERPIESILWPGESEGQCKVGVFGVTKIEAYSEGEEGSYMLWFKIWHGDWLATRVNAAHIDTVCYGELEATNG